MVEVDSTHDASLRSWVSTANIEGTDFPIQNLPHGVFRRTGQGESWRGGVAIGDQIVDLSALPDRLRPETLPEEVLKAAALPQLNMFMGMGTRARRLLRRYLSDLLSDSREPAAEVLVPQAECEYQLPADIGDYSDFFCSYHHAINSGRLHRPDNPLAANFMHLPVGYHGRSSTIIVSGNDVRRPSGQSREDGRIEPEFAPSRMVDYEAELGFYVGHGSAHGEPIPIGSIRDHIFGASILNDWSARDFQVWETQPAGPLLAKNFATSMSPWIVTMDALAPFREAHVRPIDGPEPLPYLRDSADSSSGAFAIEVSVYLQTAQDRRHSRAPSLLSTSTFSDHYWTIGQIFTHHASNGCALRPGDVIASGTISNAEPNVGSLLELAFRGKRPITLNGGETRKFLEDGDEVIMRAKANREGFVSIGFGECRGAILPARS